VEKALRQVAESKARAQDEAAEWKRKYEMERLRAASIEQERDQEREQEPEQCQSPPGMSNILVCTDNFSL
jgi:NAD+ kinase